MQIFQTLKSTYDLATLKAKAVKYLAYVGLLALLLTLSYCTGVRHTNNAWNAKEAAAKIEAAKTQTTNAIGAGTRLSVYTKTQADVDAAVKTAKQEVADYYKNNPTGESRTVEKVKLIPVPGKEELVYVPIGTCPNDLFGPDELRLFNKGNKASDYVPDHSK